MSAEEYLGMERDAGVKHEYVEGQMFAMSGGTLAHSQIPLNIAVALKRQLDGKGCGVSNSDLRIQISPSGPLSTRISPFIVASRNSPTINGTVC